LTPIQAPRTATNGQVNSAPAASLINPYRDFLPAKKSFYTYQGSLTTFPCTEGVTWIVYTEPLIVPEDHIKKIRAAVAANPATIIDPLTGNDNRPIQALNGRVVNKYIDHSKLGSLRG
jgi:carbonic anhydrase